MNRLILAVACFLFLSTLAHSQTNPSTTTKAASGAQIPKEIDPEVLQRRSIALSLLQSLAIEARSYRDEPLRARVQARIADALWEQDKDYARGLFRRAWEAAEAIETNAANEVVRPGVRNSTGGSAARPRTNLRREILQLAARRDHVLGEEFLARLTAQTEARPNNDDTDRPPMSAAEMAERFRLANGFLAMGNVERAVQFADPALIKVTTGSIYFLLALREINAAAADARFARLLAIAGNDSASDANTVSLLTTYAFTPSIVLTVSPNGFPSSVAGLPHPAPDLPPAFRKSFFQVVANILLRPFDQIDQSSAGRSGTYFIATRLLPLFQQFAPDLAPAISAQLAALGPEAGRATANAGDISVNRGMNNDGQREAIDDELKDRLDRAQGSDGRDRAYAFVAMRAAEEGDARARDFVDKIEDTDTRTGVRRFVEFRIVGSLLTKKRVDEALALMRKADLPHTLRAAFITKAASIIVEKDRVRAMELLEEALNETRRIDASTPDRAYSLIALLAQFTKLDKTRGWGLVSETVKAANAVPDFTGENGHTSQLLEGKFSIQLNTELIAPTDLSDTFVNLAAANFYQALDAGRTFTGDAPRALVSISIARAVFEEKPDKPSSGSRTSRPH
jgi:hypothetical protein